MLYDTCSNPYTRIHTTYDDEWATERLTANRAVHHIYIYIYMDRLSVDADTTQPILIDIYTLELLCSACVYYI